MLIYRVMGGDYTYLAKCLLTPRVVADVWLQLVMYSLVLLERRVLDEGLIAKFAAEMIKVRNLPLVRSLSRVSTVVFFESFGAREVFAAPLDLTLELSHFG